MPGFRVPAIHRDTDAGVAPIFVASSLCDQPSLSKNAPSSFPGGIIRSVIVENNYRLVTDSQMVMKGRQNPPPLPLVAQRWRTKIADVVPLGERIEAARRDMGIDRKELASRAGIATATLSRYVNGKREQPRQAQLRALAKVLGVNVEWLAEGTEPRYQGFLEEDEPEIVFPAGVPEAIRIAVKQQLAAEQETHRRALIAFWQERAKSILEHELRRRGSSSRAATNNAAE